MKKTITAVVFDMDGVLFDTERIYMECWREAAEPMGLKNVDEISKACIGRTLQGTKEVFEAAKAEDITSYFQKIICGDMVEHGKPAPDIYLKACEELGVAPGQALAVEDSFNGIRSAYAAGLYTVMVPDQLPPTEEILAMVDKKCDSLTELQAQLPELLAVCGD